MSGVPVKAALLALAALVVAARPGVAQGQIEVGFDGGVRLDGVETDVQVFTIALPLASVRTGLHLGRRFSLESSLTFERLELTDVDDATLTQLEVALYGLYHFGSDIARTRVHLLAGVPFRYARESGEDAFTTVGLMAGLGVTLPMTRTWAVRMQTQALAFESEQTRLSFLLGFSAILD